MVFSGARVLGAEEESSPFITVNQVGYLSALPKIALVSTALGLPFEVLDLDHKAVVLKSMLTLGRANDACSGANMWRADFSVIQATGTYQVVISGVGRSPTFRIGHFLYDPLARAAMKSFYFQRSALPLLKKYADKWTRPAYHLSDGEIFGATGSGPHIQAASGGWYDGGDYGKYVISGAFSAGLLLMLHELQPNRFPDGSLSIPESGNGVPDILDEVRWELEWLLRMQNEEGGVYHKLTALEPNPLELPNEKDPPRYLMPVSVTATADFCALMAKAARIYQDFDVHFATQCLQASLHAWRAMQSMEDAMPFENPPSVHTKPYSDRNDWEERFWAETELYYTTRENDYLRRAQALAEKRVPLLASSGYWGNVMPLAVGAMIVHAAGRNPSDLEEEAFEDVLSLAEALMDKIDHSGLTLSLGEGEFTWGSNGMVMQNTIILLLANHIHPNPVFHDDAVEQLHYLLGRNPLSMSYVTGIGHRSPKKPYHPFSEKDKVEEPVPGLLVGGPNQFLNDGLLKRTFPAATPPALIYLDDVESFSSNETSISWNAALTFVASWMADE